MEGKMETKNLKLAARNLAVSALVAYTALSFSGCKSKDVPVPSGHSQKVTDVVEAVPETVKEIPKTIIYAGKEIPTVWKGKVGPDNIALDGSDNSLEVISFRSHNKYSCSDIDVNKAVLPDDCKCIIISSFQDSNMDGVYDSCKRGQALNCLANLDDDGKSEFNDGCKKTFSSLISKVKKAYESGKFEPFDESVFSKYTVSEGELCERIEKNSELRYWRDELFRKFLRYVVKDMEDNRLVPDDLGMLRKDITGKMVSAMMCGVRGEYRQSVVDSSGNLIKKEKCVGEYVFHPVERYFFDEKGELDCSVDGVPPALKSFIRDVKKVFSDE
jgi:hypothetical protein